MSDDGLSPIDAVEDACAAFAWARDPADVLGIDPKRVAGEAIRIDHGRVLVVGGWSAGDKAEIFDPATGLFSPTATDRP